MIKIENLDIKINNKHILDDVNIDFQEGKFNTIIGPNGCGKSTLIKAVAGVLNYKKGNISINGENLKDMSKKELAKKVAFVMQHNNGMDYFTVEELVAYGRQPYLKGLKGLSNEDHEVIDWAIDVTGLEAIRKAEVANLSGGEKQRVYLALALAQEPEILILDEPTNHLDLKFQYIILNLVKKINKDRKMTIICVLHDLNHALRFSDYVFIMQKGKLHSHGKNENVITEEVIKDLYEVNCKLCRNDKYQYIEVV